MMRITRTAVHSMHLIVVEENGMKHRPDYFFSHLNVRRRRRRSN